MDHKIRYLIVGYSRSGTTITHLALMGHPAVCALNDELKIEPFFTKGISTFTHGNDTLEEKRKGYSALFNALTLILSNEHTMAHGLKIACNWHKDAKRLVQVLQENLRDLKVIIIIRKDMAAQLGSAMSGVRTGIMHSWYKGFENRKVNHLKISKWYFTTYVLNVLKMYKELYELMKTHDVLEIRYEDLLADPRRFYGQLFNFLSLPDMQPAWIKSRKVMPAPEDYILNYHELRKRQEEIESGTLPVYSKLHAYFMKRLHWAFKSIFPRKQKKKQIPIRKPDEAGNEPTSG